MSNLCKNCKRETHPAYLERYNGFCLDCDNAGVPALLEQVQSLRDTLQNIWAHPNAAFNVAGLPPQSQTIREMVNTAFLSNNEALALVNRQAAYKAQHDRNRVPTETFPEWATDVAINPDGCINAFEGGCFWGGTEWIPIDDFDGLRFECIGRTLNDWSPEVSQKLRFTRDAWQNQP